MITRGLRPLPKDENDFNLGAVRDLPRVEDLPEEYTVGDPFIRDQGNTDFCTGFASSLASSFQEEVPLSAEYAFALAKEEDKESWGLDLRTIVKSHVKKGTVKLSDAPYSLENKPDTFLRDIDNWPPELRQLAQEHRKKSFWTPAGGYDAFDNIRVSMYGSRHEKSAPIIGLVWGWPLTQVRMKDPVTQGFGHCMCVIGWTVLDNEPYLKVANSAGKSAGDNGTHYMSRDVINANIEKYGAFLFTDITREEAEYYLENGLKETTFNFEMIVHNMIDFLKKLYTALQKFFGII